MAKGSWTDTTDKQLLLTVIQLSAPARPKWEQVAALMGEGYTSESVRQHFQKLNKLGVGNAAGSDATAAPSPTTPAKRTPGKKAKGEKSSAKRKVENDEDNGCDDEEASPTKKMKVVKGEEDDSEF